MSKHLTTQQLSEYMDGEAKRPARIREHLQQCAECARRHMELSKLSSHVAALEAPAVSPNFAARVLRTIEERQVQKRPWAIPYPVGLAAAAAIVVAFAATGYLRISDTPTPQVAISIVPQDEQVYLAELEEKLVDGATASLIVVEELGEESSTEIASGDDILLALAGANWFKAFADAWDNEPVDVDTALALLDAEEAENFRILLGEYARNEILNGYGTEG